jgi:hypothetical protein
MNSFTVYPFTVTTEGGRTILISSRKYSGMKYHVNHNHAILISIKMI